MRKRLNDISTKICERLRPVVGLTIGERSLAKIRSKLPKHLKETVQQLPKRHWIYLNGKENPVVEIPKYHKEGKVTYLKPKKKKPRTEPEKRGILQRIVEKVTGVKEEEVIKRMKGKSVEEETDREFREDDEEWLQWLTEEEEWE